MNETTIEERAAHLQNWLSENAPYVDDEQKHLDVMVLANERTGTTATSWRAVTSSSF